MSVPVLLSIVLNMQAALQTITAANGYNYDIAATSVVLDPEPPLGEVPSSSTPFLRLGHLIEPVSRDFKSKPYALQDRWRIVVQGIVDCQGFAAGELVAARAQLEADVERALMVDPTRGGFALFTYPQQSTMDGPMPNEVRAYIDVPVEVLVQRRAGVA